MIYGLTGGPESSTYLLYLVAFALATATCLGAAWRARSIPYAGTRRALTAFFLGSGAWAGTYVGFLVIESELGKHLFYQGSLVVGFATVWAWLWFCSAYSGKALHRNATALKFAAVVFAVVTGLKVTNPLHELYYTLEPVDGPFGFVVVHGTLYWVVMSLSYALSAAGYAMLFELFLKTGTRIGPLAGLTALTALPAALNVIGHVEPALLDITHEPLGVAAFAVGLLYTYAYQFQAARVAGSIEDPNLMLGPDGTIRDYGGGASRTFPELDQSTIGTPLGAVLPGLAEALRQERPVWQRAMGDEVRYYQVTETSLAGSGENQVVVLSDITQREQQRRALDRQNDLFERAESLAGVGAWEYDLQEEELRWTDEVYRIYGVDDRFEPTLEEVIGLACPDHRPKLREAFRQVIEEKRSQSVVVRLNTGPDGDCSETKEDEDDHQRSGAARWVRVRGVPRRPSRNLSSDEEGRDGDHQNGEESPGTARLVRGAIQDITEQKRRERRLEAAKEEAEEAARLKSAMLANMSHEIRTPLTSIIGFAEALGAEAQEGETASHFAALIEKSGRRLLDTLDGVLNLSQLEAGQMNLEAGPVDLATQVRDVVDELRPEAEENGLDLQVEADGGARWARADTGGVQIVLQNLVSNAIKYTEEGHVRVRVRVEEDAVALEVEDTGIGLDSDQVEQLFEPFRQESEGFGREYEGTGLGLAVTKKAVDQMGGDIEVESEKGEGSRFTAWLPAAATRDATEDRRMEGEGVEHAEADSKALVASAS
jgi:signal transduction histidine kinase